MNLRVIEKKEEPLLSRQTVAIDLTYDGATPARKTLLKEVASVLGVSEGLVSILRVKNTFGATKARIAVHVYKESKEKERIEKSYLSARGMKKEDAAAKDTNETAEAAPVKEG